MTSNIKIDATVSEQEVGEGLEVCDTLQTPHKRKGLEFYLQFDLQ